MEETGMKILMIGSGGREHAPDPQAGPGRAASGAGEKVSGRLNCRQKELEGIAFQLFFLSVKVSFSLPSAGT